jgi:hypothetical protein
MDYKELSVTLRYFKVICALQDFYFVERVLNFRELRPYLVRQRTTQKFVNEIKLCVGVYKLCRKALVLSYCSEIHYRGIIIYRN